MEKEILRNIRLGIFMVIGVIMLIIALYFIGDNKNIFGSTFKLNTTFENIGGLQTGNNVRYAGIDIGTVEKIEMKNDTTIHVVMVIDAGMKNFIRANSITSIGTDGLMGNRLVNIDPGTSESSFVEPGSEIPSQKSVNTEAMLRTLEYTNDNVAFVSENLKNITDNIGKSRGSMYSALFDTSLSSELHRIMKNIESVSKNLSLVSAEASSIVNDIKKGNGIAGALIYDTVMTKNLQSSVAEIKNTSEKFSASSQQLNEILNKFNNGNGIASVLLNDSISAENLQQSISNLKTSSAKLDEDLEGLKHSFLLRGYFKKQEKLKKKEEQDKRTIKFTDHVNKKDSLPD
ncbi:MAG TPA: MlaD family protein [Bacteroidia bacterium]|nr:MlaD family protein [Bacteroidia bacterium]